MADILQDTISVEDLKVFEQKFYEELQRPSGSGVSESTQFQYACCLVRSGFAADVRKGVQLLQSLLNSTTSAAAESTNRDYLYFLAVGCAKVKEYVDSLRYLSQLLRQEPNNRQARELEAIVKKKMEREAYVGMAVTGGTVLAVGGLVGLAMAFSRR